MTLLWTSRRYALAVGRAEMPMKNPPHPGEGIKDDLDALGYSVAEAAEVMGVSRQALHNLILGRAGISADMALRLEKAIGATARFWPALQASYDLTQARRRGEPEVKKLEPRVA